MKLVKFLMKLANESVVVETKNDTKIHGTVVGVDMSMNIHLKNVKVTYRHRTPVNMDHLTIPELKFVLSARIQKARFLDVAELG